MLRINTAACAFLLLARVGWAAETDPCAATTTTPEVQLSLAVKDGQTVFHEGEIIPLLLSFTSTATKRYWADDRGYDRSGRLTIETYCVEPEALDPIASYFNKAGGYIGGGLGGTRELGPAPFVAKTELNEWRRPAPGHYRVYAISYRVWRPPDAKEETPYGRIEEVVRSNTVEFEVQSADKTWQSGQLENALQVLGAAPTGEAEIHAARVIRFLSTPASTRALARLLGGPNEQQPVQWDFMLGLYGAPDWQAAVDAMRKELAAPQHAISGLFLNTLVGIQVNNDPAWDPPAEQDAAFWEHRRAHLQALMKAELEDLVAALPRKQGQVRALTLNAMLQSGVKDAALMQTIRPALIASWKDLPRDTQQELIGFRWELLAGPEMLPILRGVLAEPPPPARTQMADARSAALKHVYELDAAEGRSLILRDLLNPKAEPGMDVIKLLPAEEIATGVSAAVARIGHGNARNMDYDLLDRYADARALGAVQAAFESHPGQNACDPQSKLLRYFLRVAPDYGARQVKDLMAARKSTLCYRLLLQGLGDQIPAAEQSAIDALEDSDPDVVQDAAIALGRWGTAAAEAPLWARLERLHAEWAGHETEIRSTPPYNSPVTAANALQQVLTADLAGGSGWICPPEKLARLAGLALTSQERLQVEAWEKQWKETPFTIDPSWFPEDSPMFAVLATQQMSEDQLAAKLTQFPRGTRFAWRMWKPGQIAPPVSMEKQQAVFERMKAVAEEHGSSVVQEIQP